jgi:hypothetical protein
MMLVCGVEGAEPEPGVDMEAATEGWVEEMTRRGIRLPGQPIAARQMWGYDLLECKDLDEAIEVASKHPVARFGMIEVRPVWTG